METLICLPSFPLSIETVMSVVSYFVREDCGFDISSLVHENFCVCCLYFALLKEIFVFSSFCPWILWCLSSFIRGGLNVCRQTLILSVETLKSGISSFVPGDADVCRLLNETAELAVGEAKSSVVPQRPSRLRD